VVRCVVDEGGEEQADGDGELVGAHDESSDPFRGRLRLVKGDWTDRSC
jgi:hypothetical protein